MSKSMAGGKKSVEFVMQTGGGPRMVQGEPVGKWLAVSISELSEPEGWSITHIPTGYRATHRFVFSTKKTAIQYAEWLDATFGDLWDFDSIEKRPFNESEVEKMRKKMLDIRGLIPLP